MINKTIMNNKEGVTRWPNSFIMLLLLITSPHLSGSWQTMIESKKPVMSEHSYDLIWAQNAAYIENRLPKIAASGITTIPIIESYEPLVDVRQEANTRIDMLPNPAAPFESPDKNSGFVAASKIRRGIFQKLNILLEKLDALAKYFGYEQGQITIKVFEGLRDLKTQELLFNNKLEEIRLAHPTLTDDQLFEETAKWVSPISNNVPVHSTGGAVDIRLWDSYAKIFVDMGPFGVIWGDNSSAPTFSENATEQQQQNRLYLLIAATEAGLVNYPYEWWHYSSGDRYAAYWQEANVLKRYALYNTVS